MIQSVVMFILKIFLGGIFKNIQNKEAEAASREADKAKIFAGTAEEVKDVEVDILKKQQDIDKVYKDKTLPDSDPFGFTSFNQDKSR